MVPKNLLELVIAERKSGKGFSRIRKELIDRKKIDEFEVNKAIGIIHDQETELNSYEISKRKNLSLTIGSLTVFIASSVYTLITYYNPDLSYFVLLYGPIIASFCYGFMSFEKYQTAKNQIQLLENKFSKS